MMTYNNVFFCKSIPAAGVTIPTYHTCIRNKINELYSKKVKCIVMTLPHNTSGQNQKGECTESR